MDSKRLKIYKRTRINTSNETRKMDREDTEDIITTASIDDSKHHVSTETKNNWRHQTPQRTGRESARTRSLRAATVCLALMCVLLLTGVIMLGVHLCQIIEEFYITNKNLTDEINELHSKKDFLLNNITELSNLNKAKITENQQVQQKMTKLWQQIKRMDGWICYQSRLYFVSSEKKNWMESRRDCTERGADLIIVNDKEEQGFLRQASGNFEVWIGLTDSATEGTWKWVDDSALSPGFWGTEKPSGGTEDVDCAVNQSAGFAAYSCDKKCKWVCEREN